ncbi:hypothetical protein KM043_016431 [Ampulex compressa]|nr:hypothetical protein KM043_016431 [Ampulex compressa]
MRRFREGGPGPRGAGVRPGGGAQGAQGRSERVKNITSSHTGADSRMKRALTNTNNGRHKRMAGRCAKNRPTQSRLRCFGGIIAFHVPGGSSIRSRPTRAKAVSAPGPIRASPNAQLPVHAVHRMCGGSRRRSGQDRFTRDGLVSAMPRRTGILDSPCGIIFEEPLDGLL